MTKDGKKIKLTQENLVRLMISFSLVALIIMLILEHGVATGLIIVFVSIAIPLEISNIYTHSLTRRNVDA